jgi:hypothetical protein
VSLFAVTLLYCRLAPSRPKSSRKMLIGRWIIITIRIAKVIRNQRRETAANQGERRDGSDHVPRRERAGTKERDGCSL